VLLASVVENPGRMKISVVAAEAKVGSTPVVPT